METQGKKLQYVLHQAVAARHPGATLRRGGGRTAVLAAMALAVAGAATAAARATVIYQDNFGRTGALDGSTPAPTDTAGATWAAYTDSTGTTIQTNGSAAVLPSGAHTAGYLPLTLAANTTYQYSATLLPVATSSDTNSTDWLAMGFGSISSQSDVNAATSEAWLIYRGNSGTQSFYGGATGNGAAGGYGNISKAPPAPSDTFYITLVTPANLASGSASVSFWDSLGLIGTAGSPRTEALASSNLANITDIFIGEQGWGGQVSDLTLQTVVPEPAALGLMALGGLGLLVGKRRRKSA